MTNYRLTKEGEEYRKNGLPEKNLFELLQKDQLSVNNIQKKMKHADIALLWLKKKKIIQEKNGEIFLVSKKMEFPEQDALEKISKGETVNPDILEVLFQRKLVQRIYEEVEKLSKQLEKKKVSELTPIMLKTGLWKKAKLAPININVAPQKIVSVGKSHPYRQVIDDIRKKLIGLGFVEARGPLVEMNFWNFDALFMPSDHPARGIHDVLNVKNSQDGKVLDKQLWGRVEATHENGWITGSRGWGSWDFSFAKKLLLRSQGTALSARTLSKLKKEDIPHKMFMIDRVFRSDVIDAKHLAEFDQCEGIVVGEGLNLKNLLGYLKEIVIAVTGAEKVRFKPSYFPFTEPSVEGLAYHPELGWVEIGGSGIFRPEVTLPLGIEVPVLAWGLGIGRLAMIKLGVNDIRYLYSDNLKWLREKSLVK